MQWPSVAGSAVATRPTSDRGGASRFSGASHALPRKQFDAATVTAVIDSPRRTTRRILIAWGGYALLWIAMITGDRWIPDDSGLLTIAGFGFALVIVAVATAAATVKGFLEFRTPYGHSLRFRTIVVLSAAGVLGQLAYMYAFW